MFFGNYSHLLLEDVNIQNPSKGFNPLVGNLLPLIKGSKSLASCSCLCSFKEDNILLIGIRRARGGGCFFGLMDWRSLNSFTLLHLNERLSLLRAEICAVSRISKKEIGRCFKLILKALETSVDLITTGDFMSRFCSNLGLPKQVQMAATFIARKAVELDLVPGRSPISVAAAAIYMASQASAEKKTQKGA